MSFSNKATHFDLSELNIERLFITDFMPVASGTHVKVYLLGYMFANSGQHHYRTDNRLLATTLQLPLQDVQDAWREWEKKGIVICHPHDEGDDFDVEFLSLRALYIDNNYISKQQKRTAPEPKARSTGFRADQDAFTALIRDIEKIVGHPLTPSEYRELSDYYDHYYKDASILCRAFEYNYKERNITGFKRIKTLLNQWLKAGLNSREAIDAYILHSSERHVIYKEVLNLIGQGFRLPYAAETEFMDKWLDQFGYDPAVLFNFVKHFSTKTANINFNYLDARLTECHAQGIKRVEEISATKTAVQPKAQEVKKTPKRHQYTVEKDRSYTEDELEDMLLNKKKPL